MTACRVCRRTRYDVIRSRFEKVSYTVCILEDMARRRPQGLSWRKARAKNLQALAVILLAAADDAEDEMIALMVARMAQKAKQEARSKKYGMRGPYDEAKVDEFFENLLTRTSERKFKAWFRCVN